LASVVSDRPGDTGDVGPTGDVPSPDAVRRELGHILSSPDLDASRRSREFLAFVVDEALAGRGDALTQAMIATRVFGRRSDFDPTADPIVRIQAGRLRRSLERYYLLSGGQDPVRIELPKGSYAPVFRRATTDPAPLARRQTDRKPTDGWPSVVVGDFEVAPPTPALEKVGAQMSEEMALELGRYRAVRILRRRDWDALDPAVRAYPRFTLEARVRRSRGDDLSVSARLVDRETGEQIWADEYDSGSHPGMRAPEDVARVIAARVAAEEGVLVQLLATERRRTGGAGPTPYDAFLRSYDFLLARDPEAFAPAVEALKQVVGSDPGFGLAWTRLARVHLANYAFAAAPSGTSLDEAIVCAQKGVRADPADRPARCVLAAGFLYKGELDAAREQLDTALASGPDSLVYLEIIGYLLILSGRRERGEAVSRNAIERNPNCLPHVLFGLWTCQIARGEFEQAYRTALDYRDPMFFVRSVMRASSLGLLGRKAEAAEEVADLLSGRPDFKQRGRALLGHHIKFPDVMDRIVEGLARVGLEID
jgi:adenylate cyclase